MGNQSVFVNSPGFIKTDCNEKHRFTYDWLNIFILVISDKVQGTWSKQYVYTHKTKSLKTASIKVALTNLPYYAYMCVIALSYHWSRLCFDTYIKRPAIIWTNNNM